MATPFVAFVAFVAQWHVASEALPLSYSYPTGYSHCVDSSSTMEGGHAIRT